MTLANIPTSAVPLYAAKANSQYSLPGSAASVARLAWTVWVAAVAKANRLVWVSTAALSAKLASPPDHPKDSVVLRVWRSAMASAVQVMAMSVHQDNAVNQRTSVVILAVRMIGLGLSSLRDRTAPIDPRVSAVSKARWILMVYAVDEARSTVVAHAAKGLVHSLVSALGRMPIARLDGVPRLARVLNSLNVYLAPGAVPMDVVFPSPSKMIPLRKTTEEIRGSC